MIRKSDQEIEGQQLWPDEDVFYCIKKTWQSGFEFSAHTLGDEAVHRVVQIARKVSALGVNGILNLEHVEVLRQETIQLMKPLHIRCHLQPCHLHSDKIWLKERLGKKIAEAFPWERLRINQIPFFFGSDSPIEQSSLQKNLSALNLSDEMGIKKLSVDPIQFHQYPWSDGISSQSIFKNQKLIQVNFN